jgi:MFS transporter, PPP family, 3-phenylpropionic acid transporter
MMKILRARGPDEGPAGFAVRLAVFYAAIFTVLGVYLPYLPVWLAWRGLTPAEIGIITAAPLFARVVATPLITFVADRRGDHTETILALAWVGAVAVSALTVAAEFWPILALVAAFQIANQSMLPLTEAKAMAGVRTHDLDYGRIRLWGSLSFIAANLIGGAVLATFGGGGIIYFVIAAVAFTIAAGYALPSARAIGTGRSATAHKPVRLADLRRLVGSPWFIVLMTASGCIQASHAVYYAFSAIHWRGHGISDGWIGGLWALGVLAEVVLFAYSGSVMRRFGAARLVLLGGAAAALRWSVMAFDPPFSLLLILQCLHALSFGATFLGTLYILQNSVPENHAGSAQGLHAALAPGIVTGVVTVVAGQIYEPLQALSYIVMAVLALVGSVAAIALPRIVPSSERH